MHVEQTNPSASPTEISSSTEIAFLDARRLGRVRLVTGSPLNCPPISALGFDPILSMPDLPTFSPLLLKRTCPIKALLLDQSFSAGVGNWVADEVLYHARVHPEQRCNTLSEEQVERVWKWTVEVCRVAVEANADDTKFPEDWLFKHRWVSPRPLYTLSTVFTHSSTGQGQREESQSRRTAQTGEYLPTTLRNVVVVERLVTALRRTRDYQMDHSWWSDICIRCRASTVAKVISGAGYSTGLDTAYPLSSLF